MSKLDQMVTEKERKMAQKTAEDSAKQKIVFGALDDFVNRELRTSSELKSREIEIHLDEGQYGLTNIKVSLALLAGANGVFWHNNKKKDENGTVLLGSQKVADINKFEQEILKVVLATFFDEQWKVV